MFGGWFGGEEEKPEEPEIDDSAVVDPDTLACRLRAQLAEEGPQLPPLADLYAKDPNKLDQIQSFMQQYTLLLEFQRMHECLPSGMYVSPSTQSIFTWHGVMFIRSGLYRGGIFKFQLDLPEEYPELPPTFHFTTDIYHPMVEPESGRVDIDVWFPDWRPGSDYAAAVLPRVHKAIVQREQLGGRSDGVDPANMEACELYKESPAKFAEKAKECVAASLKKDACFWNPDGALLRFAETPAENHEDLLKALRETDVPSCSLDERKCMFVEWFTDYYVRNRILKPKKKKKKKGKEDVLRDRRPTGGDLASLKKFAEQLAELEDDEEEEDEEEEQETDPPLEDF